jgi:hypothetical protein
MFDLWCLRLTAIPVLEWLALCKPALYSVSTFLTLPLLCYEGELQTDWCQ